MMKGQTDDGDTDRLSDLPDHVLVRIIEAMHIKHSVQTCVLSKRWKNLWKSLTNLTLLHFIASSTVSPISTVSTGNSHIFNKFVSQILFGRDNSTPLHRLYYMHVDEVDPPKTTLFEALKYAASHNVKQLQVFATTAWRSPGSLDLPPSIFCCRTLTYLSLNFWHPLFYDNQGKKMFPKSLNLPALKTLRLMHLTFTTNENGYAEPFSTCNKLTTLVITGCYLQDDAQALLISNSNLTRLTASGTRMIEQAHNYKFVFSTPKLISLTIIDRPNFPAPCAASLPFLKELKIDYHFFSKPYEDVVLKSWLGLLANVNIITLGFNTLQEILRVTRTQHPCFVRLKSLKVEMHSKLTISQERVQEMIADLLQNSPLAKVDIIRKPDLTL